MLNILTDIVLYTVVPFLFALTLVVFVHEFGHFIVARWCGVKVDAFSIGFGREIWGFHDKHGTRWRIAWIPLGGYVKFVDDDNAASVPTREQIAKMTPEQRAGSFHAKSLPARAAVVAAGPIFNFLFAILIFAAIFSIVGVQTTAPLVDKLVKGGAAEQAGLKQGDLIVGVDGTKITTFNELKRLVSASAGRQMALSVKRGERVITVQLTPQLKEIKDRFGNKIKLGLIGIERTAKPQEWELKRYDPLTAVWLGTKECYFVVERTLSYLGDVAMGRQSGDQLSGPIGIATATRDMAKLGMVALLNMIGFLSVALGFANLLPIPILDGGHLVFYAYEGIRGRPLNERAQEIAFRIGFVILICLMLIVTRFDVLRVWDRWTG
ncbi:MAG: RIP metalloprotease RseP [Hyphomicrobiaceae bacterium]